MTYELSWAPPDRRGAEDPSPDASEPILAEPVEAAEIEQPPLPPADVGLFSLVELILKNRPRLHWLIGEPSFQAAAAPRLLAIALAGFLLFGGAISLVLAISGQWPVLDSIPAWLEQPQDALVRFTAAENGESLFAHWTNGDALRLTGAYAFGLVAASGVCLPSLYFYCLLAGVRMSLADVVLHALKAKAVAAVALVGVLPMYVALVLGAIVFGGQGGYLDGSLGLGLILPSVAGLWGSASLLEGFSQLSRAAPLDCGGNRACFLRRLVLAWCACYTAVTPVMVYTVWEALQRTA